MSKDDLNNWYLEDPVEATKWIQRREYRVLREQEKAEEQAKLPLTILMRKSDWLMSLFQNKPSQERNFSRSIRTLHLLKRNAEIRNSLGLPLDRALNQDEMKMSMRSFQNRVRI